MIGRKAEALKSLIWLRGNEFDIESELNQLEASVQVDLASKARPSDLLLPWAYKPILTALALMSFQQVIGINAALFNSVDIFKSAGSDLDPLVSAVILNAIQVDAHHFSKPIDYLDRVSFNGIVVEILMN